MEKRLVKIAKELNVSITTIVEFLHKNGYEIENKPTAWISDDMHTILLKEFQKSMDIREQADQLVIGTRPMPKKDIPVAAKTDKIQPGTSILGRKDEAQPAKDVKPMEEEKPRGLLPNRLKILGKIDLDAHKAKRIQKDPLISSEENIVDGIISRTIKSKNKFIKNT